MHGLFSQLVASVQSITLSLAQADNETSLVVKWNFAITDNGSIKIADHGSSCIPKQNDCKTRNLLQLQ